MDATLLINHAIITILPASLAIVIAFGLGYPSARAMRRVVSAYPNLQRWGILLPWRTVMFALLPFTTPLFSVLRFGLGAISEMFSIGTTIFLFALPFSIVIFFESWYPSPMRVRMLALTRTLLTAAVVLGTREAIGVFGLGVGIGWQLMRALGQLEYSQAFELWLMIIALVFVVDLSLGFLEMLVANRSTQAQGIRTLQ